MKDLIPIVQMAIGLDPQTLGPNTLDRAVATRMKGIGVQTIAEYSKVLRQNPREQQALVEELVVPETWFFRDRPVLELVAELARNLFAARGRRVRILSAPCSSGEEPYSLVMALLESGLKPSSFSVDAVDVSEKILVKAKSAIYGSNSFRDETSPWRERYFRTVEGQFEFIPAYRSLVQFTQASLVDPAFMQKSDLFDFIFCRNVLIYFDADSRAKALNRLKALLQPEGRLIVTPAEAGLISRSGFTAVSAKHSAVFAVEAPRPQARRITPKVVKVSPPPKPALTPPRAPVPATPQPERSTGPTLEELEKLANEGKLEEAMKICEALLKKGQPTAQLYYLCGIVNDATKKDRVAAEFYRKALYLDPNHYESLMHLALLKEKAGDKRGAAVIQARAQRVAAK